VHGYDNIAEKMKTTISLSASSPPRDLRQELRQWFVGSGYTEVITNSMLERQIAERFERAPVEVINPISRDMTCLRTSLVPGILRVVAHNLDHGVKNLKIFEFGDVFALNQDTTKNKLVGEILEEERLILGLTGAAIPPSWDFGERRFDIFDLKGEVETLFSKISLDNHKFICYDNDKALSERRLGIEINGSYGGYLEQLSAEMRREYDIESEVFICELKYGLLEAFTSNKRRFEELPRFPSVHRDLAFVVNSQTRIGAMQEEIRRSGGSLLREVTLFDIYGGDQLDSRKKSVAFSLEFISRDRTLTEKEVDEVVKRIIDELRRKQSAVLRG
jgi:phenylalanyl-tRNA synthetase beta chain